MEKEMANIITVLDFEVGKVFQYKIRRDPGQVNDWNPNYESCEEFLTSCSHNLQNCEWMTHDDEEVIKTWKNTN